MPYTLLQLVDQACGELGLTQPSSVIGNATNQTMQMLALLQRLGKDLVREFEWQRLKNVHQFLTVPTIDTTGDLTDGSTTISTLATTANLARGMSVTSTTFAGVPVGAEITSIDSATTVSINIAATASGSTSLLFKTQDYDLPSDFDRMVPDTQWNRSNYWKNQGSRSSQKWQAYQGGQLLISAWPDQFRVFHNKVRLLPAPTAEYNMAYEYVSNLWVFAVAGLVPTKSAFSVDTDFCIFPDDLMLAGLKYYFLRAKKLDYGVEFADFNDILSTRKAQDAPAETLSMTPPQFASPLPPSVAEGNWDL